MIVRFFGGFDFQPGDANTRSPAAIGYARGVPMGGDLTAAPSGKAPTFLVAALKDPIGANLDRIQIVKGWQDAKGRCRKRSTMSPGATRKPANRTQTASCRRSATRWMWPTPPGPTPSAIPN